MPTPETVTEAVELLRSLGYVDNFELDDGDLCWGTERVHGIETAVVDHTFRFEGDSDPGDEAIVLGVSSPAWDRKGIVVSAYGPDAEHARLLVALTARR